MFGTGYGKIDTAYATEKGITVCNIAGYATNAVAELTFGLILEHIFGISRAKKLASEGDYSEDSFIGKNYEISGKNFGIVGMGKIGYRIAHIASQGFGAKVNYWNRTRRFEIECHGFTFVKDVKELIAKSDFLSINMAYVKGQNENFFNEELISTIKPNTVVINTTQMDVIDIKALSKRLAKKDMVFIEDHSDELESEDAAMLSQHENCMMYAPIGYITKEATTAKLGIFVDNLENYLKGNPTNKVN
jgi:D-3-phosphoglycerate dehydrogenase